MAKEIIEQLQGFTPSVGSIVRDQMLYDAGVSAGRAGCCHRLWRGLALGLCSTQALLLGVSWFWLADRPTSNPPVTQAPPIIVPAPVDESPTSPFPSNMLSAMPREFDVDHLPDYMPDRAVVASDEPALSAGRIPDHLMLLQ